MKSILSEKNIAVVLFVLVLVVFSLAQEDSKAIESRYHTQEEVHATTLAAKPQQDSVLPLLHKAE